ncbi:hypothetical protein DCAR_0205526 [Daucus carota subsp. sativus]|uniref:HAT C-terminal dimerisation domain-containing protein n=1 Tax=Daucus carota subsp. sativus TaxID=79200 RepID=A0AAF1AK94_DAUCS|nr:hypothetical protein DCAR_0205526 [Daucus carota subsp. sativus]
MHGVIGVAAVLDPRYKLEVLEFYFEKIFGVNAAYKVDVVRDLCYTLLKEYHDRGDVLPKIEGFDILTWWKANAPKYPNLQHMARDFLAIPASTVASESSFSSSGRLVSPHRNRLHPNTIEALMCAQSWLWAAKMKGESFLCDSASK